MNDVGALSPAQRRHLDSGTIRQLQQALKAEKHHGVEAEARIAELAARLEDAEGIIENALTGVENLPDYGEQDAAGYLVNDWQPFARIWLAEKGKGLNDG